MQGNGFKHLQICPQWTRLHRDWGTHIHINSLNPNASFLVQSSMFSAPLYSVPSDSMAFCAILILFFFKYYQLSTGTISPPLDASSLAI